MPTPIPTFDFLPDRNSSFLKGIFGGTPETPKKKKVNKKQAARMALALRKALLDKGMPIEQVNAAVADLESRLLIMDAPSGNRSTSGAIKNRKQQIEGAGDY